MVATIPTTNTDTLAREYIRSLKKGVMPSERPESFGDWEQIIHSIERACFRSHGDIKAIQDVIDILVRQNPSLNELLNPPPSLSEIVIPNEPDYPLLPDDVVLSSDLSIGACSWLDDYVSFSREASPEAYDEFHVFCGVWVLSVASARRVYLPLRMKRVYGNVMIALCARSSLFAKSNTASVAKEILLFSGLGHLIGPDRISPAKLLSDLSGSRIPADYEDWTIERQERVKKKLAMSGQKGLYFDELGKFIQGMLRKGSTNSDFADLLLTLDGCPQEYENSTIARGGEPIQKPFLPLLGAMTPSNLKENAQSGADFWTDGFWARFSFIVAPPNEYKDEPLDAEDLAIPEKLRSKLSEWHTRLGIPHCEIVPVMDKKDNKETGRFVIEKQELPETTCTIDKEAWQAWKRYRSALKKMIASFSHDDFHGSYIRLPETALRMAVLMASLENDNRIELKHWAKAQELAEVLRRNLHELYRQVNQNSHVSEIAKTEQDIINKLRYLKSQGRDGITVAQLKSCYLKNHSLKHLAETMEAMSKAGVLRKDITAHAPKGKFFIVDEVEE